MVISIFVCFAFYFRADYHRKRYRDDDRVPREPSKRSADHESRRNSDPDSRPVMYCWLEGNQNYYLLFASSSSHSLMMMIIIIIEQLWLIIQYCFDETGEESTFSWERRLWWWWGRWSQAMTLANSILNLDVNLMAFLVPVTGNALQEPNVKILLWIWHYYCLPFGILWYPFILHPSFFVKLVQRWVLPLLGPNARMIFVLTGWAHMTGDVNFLSIYFI